MKYDNSYNSITDIFQIYTNSINFMKQFQEIKQNWT